MKNSLLPVVLTATIILVGCSSSDDGTPVPVIPATNPTTTPSAPASLCTTNVQGCTANTFSCPAAENCYPTTEQCAQSNECNANTPTTPTTPTNPNNPTTSTNACTTNVQGCAVDAFSCSAAKNCYPTIAACAQSNECLR